MKGEQTLQTLAYKSHLYLKRNSSTILTFVGAIGVIATASTAVKATLKAVRLLEEAENEKNEPLTKMEVIRIAGPVYIPSIAIGVSTISCIFGANALNKRQQAALTSAYALIDNAYKEYRNKVKELYGEETDQKIRDSIALDKRKEDRHVYAPGLDSLPTDGEKRLFYESYRGGYFEATIEEVLNAEYHLNRNFATRGCVSLNEFYDFLGLEGTDEGEVLGWGCGRLIEEREWPWIDFNNRLVTLDDGLECYMIEFDVEPVAGYEEF